MTISDTSAQEKTSDPFSNLYQHKYIQLTTFRKDGTAVPTPVWFAADQGRLYVMTINVAGKVKRIRNNGRALLIPCDVRGNVSGEQVEAQAHELPASDYEHAVSVLTNKYGFLYRVFTLFQNIRKLSRTYIEIESA